MIVYNTTYTVSTAEAKNFIIWINEAFIPNVGRTSYLSNPRLLQILSHKDPDTECFSLQFEVESTALLQKWYREEGQKLIQEMLKVFGDKVVGFSTIMNDVTLKVEE